MSTIDTFYAAEAGLSLQEFLSTTNKDEALQTSTLDIRASEARSLWLAQKTKQSLPLPLDVSFRVYLLYADKQAVADYLTKESQRVRHLKKCAEQELLDLRQNGFSGNLAIFKTSEQRERELSDLVKYYEEEIQILGETVEYLHKEF